MAESVPQWSVLPSACVVWLTLLGSRSKRKKTSRFSNTVKEKYISYDDKSLIQLFEVVGRRLKLADFNSDSLPKKSGVHTNTMCQDQSLTCKMCLPCNQYMMDYRGYLLKYCLIQMVILLFADFWACWNQCSVLSGRLKKHSIANV